MRQLQLFSSVNTFVGQRWSVLCVAVSAVAILAVAASAAWLLQSGADPASAQSSQRFAATAPDVYLSALPSEMSSLRRGMASNDTRIGKIAIEPGKPSVVEGSAAALNEVSLFANDQLIGRGRATEQGAWAIFVEQGLGGGDHRLSLRTTATPDGVDTLIDTVRVSVPRTLVGQIVIAFAGAEIAPAAGKKSIEIATTTHAVDQPLASASAQELAPTRVAQLKVQTGATDEVGLASLRDWLRRAERDYQAIVVRKLTDSEAATDTSAPNRPIVLAQASPSAGPVKSPAGPTEPSVLDTLQNWLRRSNETYQKAIVKRLTEPTTLEGIEAQEAEAKRRADEAKKAAGVKPADAKPADATPVDDAQRKAQELRAAQAKRDEDLKLADAKKKASEELAAKEAAAKVAPTPTSPTVIIDDAARKQAEDKRIADETIKRQADLKAAEEKRIADAKKAADDQSAKSAEAKKAIDDASVRKQVEEKRIADAKKAADDQSAKSAEAKKATDDASARKQAEDKRIADDAAKRQIELKAADEKRAADARKAADDTAAKAAEVRKSLDDATARRQAEVKRLADEQSKRAADAKALAEEKRVLADAAKRAADEARRAGDVAREAEARRQVDLKSIDEARRKAAALAEAGAKVTIPTKPSTTAIAASPRSATQGATRQAKPTPRSEPAARMASAGRATRNPRSTRRGSPLDTSTRSALGAGRSTAVLGNRNSEASSATGCRLAGRRVKPPGYYVVKAGDTLWDIADLHYDDGRQLGLIERANRKIDPDLIHPCQRIYIPAGKQG